MIPLARRWSALFGIQVVVAVSGSLGTVPNFKTDEGETCFEMLERLARANAVMTIKGNTNQDGTITSTGDQVAAGVSTANHTHLGDSGGITGPPNK